MRSTPMLALAALLALSLVACKKPAAAPDAGTAAAPASATTASADAVGVPECDDYITKVEACVNSKMPAGQKSSVEAALNASRSQWKQAAAQPNGKEALATGCKQALAMAKTSYGAMGCTF